LSMMDDYRKGWALRYLREAKAGLTEAQKTPPIAQGLILEAMKKAQVAIYYSLGDPVFVEAIVRQTLQMEPIEDPILRCLVEIERTVQRAEHTPELNYQNAIKQANDLIQIASEIVELFTGEEAG